MDREEAKKIIIKGYELYYAGEYETALPLLIQGAEAGFIPVYVLIGDCYWNGNGVEADTTTAIQYYLSAAKMGNLDGLMRMGDVYFRCNEIEEAKKCYVEAVKKGNTDAYYNLAMILYYIDRNYSKVAEYLELYLAKNNDDAEALYLLGRCYVFMDNNDLTKAEELFIKSASLGNQKAAKDRDALQLGGSIMDY